MKQCSGLWQVPPSRPAPTHPPATHPPATHLSPTACSTRQGRCARHGPAAGPLMPCWPAPAAACRCHSARSQAHCFTMPPVQCCCAPDWHYIMARSTMHAASCALHMPHMCAMQLTHLSPCHSLPTC